ncbi:heme ABC transporter permease CcmC [Novosphingobium sp. KACC 22771]|uniref:heme ABC transporter permease CcmC n=1 Tax=Novosphingobium sp. KACC 22771 TaxID=3025670 RepID=UPI0023662C24|nr:heme ABC transporter permease CcmC [Novosphingobium sp. KACC 22771]WDF71558.1 heme ABC transporter permease CcmC [Novosphingobium sp. KACC 22771]
MHGFANPARFLRIARWATPLCLLLGFALAAWSLVWGVFFAPADALQGDTVRIIYLHVPTAWLGMGGWSAIAIASFVEIVWRHPLAGIAARAVALPGAVFTALCLITGSIWGRPAWGTWWVWDGRLTSMLVLLFLYFGYMALDAAARGSQQAGQGQSRITAIFGLVGAVNIPVIHYSVTWWNSLHQPPSITMGKSAMAADFLVPLLIATVGFSLIFGGIVMARMRTILADEQAEARLRRKAMRAQAPAAGEAW